MQRRTMMMAAGTMDAPSWRMAAAMFSFLQPVLFERRRRAPRYEGGGAPGTMVVGALGRSEHTTCGWIQLLFGCGR
jgi:hypothetical protein